MTRRPSYSEGLGFNTLGFALVATLGLISSVVTARIYGAAVLGQYALVIASANAVMLLSSARERPALVREIVGLPPRAPRVSALFLVVLGFSVVLTCAVGLAFSVAAYFAFQGPLDHPELFLVALANMAAYVVFDNTTQNIEGIMAAFRAGRSLTAVRTFQALSVMVLSAALGLAFGTVWALVAANVAGSVFSLAWRLAMLRQFVGLRVPRQELRAALRTLPDIIRFGVKIAPGAMADGISNQAGTWILGSIAGLSVVGAYNRASTIARSLLMFNNRITEMLFPTLVERHARGDHEGFDRALVDTLRYASAAFFGLAAAVGGAAPGVMRVFGPDFESAAGALAWIVLVPGLLALTLVQRHVLYVFNHPLQATASALLRLLVTLAATVPLALAYGAVGPAVALCLGLVADFLFTSARVIPRLHSPLLALWPARQLVGLPAAYAAGFLTADAAWAVVDSIVGLPFALAAGALVYAGVLLLVGGTTPGDVVRLRGVQRVLRRRRPDGDPSTDRVGSGT